MDISLVKYASVLKEHSLCIQQFLFLKFNIVKEMEKCERAKSVYKKFYCSIYSCKNINQIATEVLYNEMLYIYISFKIMMFIYMYRNSILDIF